MANTKTETFKGKMENAYSKPLAQLAVKEGFDPLPASLDFAGEYEAFINVDGVREANEFPKDEEIVDFVNNKRKANARQKAMQAVLDAAGAIRPTQDNDPQVRLRNMYKTLRAAGKSHDKARETAAMVLETEWDGEYNG